MLMTEEEFLKLNRLKPDLIRDLEPEDVLHYLQSSGTLNENDIQRIRTERQNREDKVDLMVQIFLDKSPSLRPLVDALIYARYAWLVKEMTSSSMSRDPDPDPDPSGVSHSQQGDHVTEVEKNNVSPDHQLTSPTSSSSSSRDPVGSGDHRKNPSKRSDENGSIPNDPKTQRYTGPVLVPSTSQEATTISQNLYALAVRGKIPKKPDVHVHRKSLFERLKDLLRQLEHQYGWVVVHGMSGSGKSVLAADVVRDPEILGRIFPHVFWINFDIPMTAGGKEKSTKKPTSVSERELREILLAKFHFLYSHVMTVGNHHVTTDTKPLRSIEDALLRLPDLFIRNFSRTLLVLNDVWSSYHVKNFDELPCRFLVTTQNESVMHEVNGLKYVMPMKPWGFTRQETTEAFSKWLQTTHDQLPSFADDFFSESDGHPFFISLVGSLLKAHKNRWAYYYNEIRQENLESIKSDTSINTYKHRSFNDAIRSSMMDLSDSLKQKFLDLAVFPLKADIPAKTLAVYWAMNFRKVENLMDRLCQRSLIVRRFDVSLDCDVYNVHNLLHKFLKVAILDSQSIKDLHHRLVMMYHNLTKGKWALLPKDRYIHEHIGLHLLGAELYTYFPDVFLNLKFLYDKFLACGGLDEILDDFRTYKEYIEKNDKTLYDEYANFLDRCQHVLRSPGIGAQYMNLIELAMQEPYESALYRAAVNLC